MHIPVLAAETIGCLAVQYDGTYVDCTAGDGGHTEQLARLAGGGMVIALDRDPSAVGAVRTRLKGYPNVTVVQADFRNLRGVLDKAGVGRVDGLVLDAGFSSAQLDDPERGFSFQRTGPLDMRFDPTRGESAEDYLERVSSQELARVLRDFGDVPKAQTLASEITRRARAGDMQTTTDLLNAVEAVYRKGPRSAGRARQTFQAIRIAVNDELSALETFMSEAPGCLAGGGRMAVITFHSGEDRIVKQAFRRESRPRKILQPDGRTKETRPPRLKMLTRRPVRPGPDELRRNPRARSARLRAAERLEGK